jgi:ribosomal protein L11 methyltransferase
VIRLAVRCRPEVAEAVLAELLVLAPNGVEEAGPAVPGRIPASPGSPLAGARWEEAAGSDSGWVEYAIYGAPGELPDLGEVRAGFEDGLVDVSTSAVPDDWADRWRDFHRPVLVADRLLVRPSWARPAAADAGAEAKSPSRRRGQGAFAGAGQPAGIDVVVDPGQAFGTGAHPTTRMCLELLLDLADRGEASGGFTDLGTGSGVLAIAAAKLGWDPVAGVDHERAALEAAATNAKANGVELELRWVNLREEVPALMAAVVANLTAPLLVGVAERLDTPPRWLVASGMIGSEVAQVEEAFATRGLRLEERRGSGDWAALLLAGRVDRDVRGTVDRHRGRAPK